MKTKMKKPKILFYDIETSPVRVWTFRLGEQYVDHKQLVSDDIIDIICITYCWETGPAQALVWDSKQNSKKMIEAFDKIVATADLVVGQNSDRFDAKHINTLRLMHGLAPFPEWADCSDDTLKQFKKNFNFLSNRLDYVSKLLGFGGKHKMDLQDWIKIKENNDAKALAKMIRYGKKDVIDTRAVYKKIKPYIKPKFNISTFNNGLQCCTTCGSTNIHKNGTRVRGGVLKQSFHCRAHGGYAGDATVLKNNKLGKMGK